MFTKDARPDAASPDFHLPADPAIADRCALAAHAIPIANAPIGNGADFGPVLLWASVQEFPEAWVIGRWNPVDGWVAVDEFLVVPSHWAPLPAPPVAETLAGAGLMVERQAIAAIADPLPGMWTERTRWYAKAAAADQPGNLDQANAFGARAVAIEEKMTRTRATTLDGLFVQLDLIPERECCEVESLIANIRATLVEISITDPLPSMWAERNQLILKAAAAGREAVAAGIPACAIARKEALDELSLAIDKKMSTTRATSLEGLLVQLDLIGEWKYCDRGVLQSFATNIRATIVEMLQSRRCNTQSQAGPARHRRPAAA